MAPGDRNVGPGSPAVAPIIHRRLEHGGERRPLRLEPSGIRHVARQRMALHALARDVERQPVEGMTMKARCLLLALIRRALAGPFGSPVQVAIRLRDDQGRPAGTSLGASIGQFPQAHVKFGQCRLRLRDAIEPLLVLGL